MHDTPPPTRFDDGSFSSQLKEEVTIHPAGGGRFHHRCVPTGAMAPFIAHVKVLKGNGEELHFEEYAAKAVITIELANDVNQRPAGDLKIMGGPEFFLIDSDSKLNGPNPGAKKRKKYEHPGKGQSFHISRIVVENPAGTITFEQNAPDDYEEEFTVMVWHIGDDHGPAGTVI